MADLPFGIDFGGTGIKAAPVDLDLGDFAAERVRITTPEPSTPDAVSEVLRELLAEFPDCTAPVGVTVPGVVRHGVVRSAANIDKSWIGTDADDVFTEATGREVHVVNDADAAGLAEVRYGAARGRARPGDRDHARHRHRLGAGARRRARAQLRARTPRDRRPRRRVAGGQQRPRARGLSGRSGPSGSPATTGPWRRCSPPTCSSSAAGSARRPTSSCRCSTSTPRSSRPSCATRPASSAPRSTPRCEGGG